MFKNFKQFNESVSFKDEFSKKIQSCQSIMKSSLTHRISNDINIETLCSTTDGSYKIHHIMAHTNFYKDFLGIGEFEDFLLYEHVDDNEILFDNGADYAYENPEGTFIVKRLDSGKLNKAASDFVSKWGDYRDFHKSLSDDNIMEVFTEFLNLIHENSLFHKPVKIEEGKKLPQLEINRTDFKEFSDQVVFNKWLNSGLDPEEFIKTRKGFISSKRLGL